MIVDKFEKLHAEYIQLLAEYHNHYIKCIKRRQGKVHISGMQQCLRRMSQLQREMVKELTEIKKIKREQYKDLYQGQRSRTYTSTGYSGIHKGAE